MKCLHCNAELPSHAKFCSFCGKQITSEIKCPKCGAKLPQGTIFCIECGIRIISNESNSTKNVQQPKEPRKIKPLVASDSIRLTLKTGKTTLLGTNTFGIFAISPSGVSFTTSSIISSKEDNHSYGFADIEATEFKRIHEGSQSYFGYVVTLKNGTIYNYLYSPFIVSHLEKIDQIIISQI